MDTPRSGAAGRSADSADDELNDVKGSREEQKVYKTIQRVHRACNACRKQKARCEGPEHPPCRRCKQIGIECIFEKPPKDATSSADAGPSADRIKTLETQMLGMQSMLGELVASIKANTHAIASVPAVVAAPLQADASSSHHQHSPSYRLGPAEARPLTDLRASPSSQRHPYYKAVHAHPSPPADVLARYQAEPAAPLRRSQLHPGSTSYSHMDAHPLQQASAYLLQQPSYDAFSSHRDEKDEVDYSHSSATRSDPIDNSIEKSIVGPVSWTGTQRSAHRDAKAVQQDPTAARSPDHTSWPSTSAPPPKRQWSSSTERPFEPQFSPSEATMLHAEPSETGTTGTGDRRRKVTPDSNTHQRNAKETDISNDQLSAPIEALRGLADAAAAAAAEEEDELDGHLSGDSSGHDAGLDKSVAQDAVDKAKNRVETVPTIRADEASKPFDADDDDANSRSSPRKRRRRDHEGHEGQSIIAASSVDNGSAAVSTTAAKGKMEAPELVKSSAGDLVTLGLVSASDAMRLFETFQKGVPKFISIFHLEDEPLTTEQAYQHVRTTSYFLFNTMIAIGAKVECGGRSPSRLYQTCMAQAKRNAKDTMFSSVAGKEAVQAMVLLASYSENGWLTLGLSIRMAQELELDRSFQKLMSALPSSGYIKHPQPPPPPKHLTFYHASPQSSHYTGSPTDLASVGETAGLVDNKAVKGGPAEEGNLEELKDLARGARLWFFLFLFDHQASYGAGRPAMLSKHYVRNCRAFLTLQYPLTVKTDARFISTLELLIIRETHYDAMAPYDQPVDSRMLLKMRKVSEELNEWHHYWSVDFEKRGYGQDSFFQQSLILQCASAELYLTCTALRGIRDANDADHMGPEQKELIIQATRAADTCLTVSVHSKEYREMLGWAPHYTHVTAAFACVFLIKIARLFPRQVDTYGIFSNAERLASRLAEVPATKYARVIRILLAQAWKKITDLSPAIGLYAALGAEATRPGAITPAEIKTGGPSDSGISLLYKLLQEHQQGQLPLNASDELASSSAMSAPGPGGGSRTPKGMWDLHGQSNWLMTAIASPSFNIAGGTVSPRKYASLSGKGATPTAEAVATDGVPWGNFLTGHTPSAVVTETDGAVSNLPLQLPVWMQESTGVFIDLTSNIDDRGSLDDRSAMHNEDALRNWGHQDHYQSPVPHNAASPAFQTSHHLHTPHQARHSGPGQQQMHFLGPPHHQQSSLQQQHAYQTSIPHHRFTPAQSTNNGLQSAAYASTSNTDFDNVLSDLGLPLDGLDGLFVDLPINAPTGQSNHSV